MIHDSFPPQGKLHKAHEGSQSRTGTQVAGDVHDISDAMKNIQESNKISRSIGGLPTKSPPGTKNVVPLPNNPMSYE